MSKSRVVNLTGLPLDRQQQIIEAIEDAEARAERAEGAVRKLVEDAVTRRQYAHVCNLCGIYLGQASGNGWITTDHLDDCALADPDVREIVGQS